MRYPFAFILFILCIISSTSIISNCTDEQLVDCLVLYNDPCDCLESKDQLLTTLKVRNPLSSLFERFSTSNDASIKIRIIFYLMDCTDPRVFDFMKANLSNEVEQHTYFMLIYLGNHGDASVVDKLFEHYSDWPISSADLSYSIPLFAEYNYRKAIPTLIGQLEAASLNLAIASDQALHELFPNSPDHPTRTDAISYFTEAYNREIESRP